MPDTWPTVREHVREGGQHAGDAPFGGKETAHKAKSRALLR